MKIVTLFFVVLVLTVLTAIAYDHTRANDEHIKVRANQQPITVTHEEKPLTLKQRTHLNPIYFEINKEERLKRVFLRKQTKHWQGKVDGVRFHGFNEELHGSKNFYLSQNKEAKEFLAKNS